MRLLITGASGSGATTLGKAMASRLRWHFIDADDFYWLPTRPPYRLKRDHATRLRMILEELRKHGACVVSGSIINWGAELEDSFDLIAFLYLDASIRVERLKIREEEERGYANPEFLKWASEYDIGPSVGRSLAKHKQWLSERPCRVLTLEGDLTVQERCELLTEALASIAANADRPRC